MNATDRRSLSSKQINHLKAQPSYLRRVAADYEELGSHATAEDYYTAADDIETLLAVLGLPIFTD